MMTEGLDPIRLSGNAKARRLWLLHEAMRSLPFDRVIELASIAEAFVRARLPALLRVKPCHPQ